MNWCGWRGGSHPQDSALNTVGVPLTSGSCWTPLTDKTRHGDKMERQKYKKIQILFCVQTREFFNSNAMSDFVTKHFTLLTVSKKDLNPFSSYIEPDLMLNIETLGRVTE